MKKKISVIVVLCLMLSIMSFRVAAQSTTPTSHDQVLSTTPVDIEGMDALTMGIDPQLDSDGDGLVDVLEYTIGSNPFIADTDEDGVDDFTEFCNTHTNLLK